jgi:hypothetical protein
MDACDFIAHTLPMHHPSTSKLGQTNQVSMCGEHCSSAKVKTTFQMINAQVECTSCSLHGQR